MGSRLTGWSLRNPRLVSAAPASGCSRLFLTSAVVLALMLLLVEGSLALLSYLSLPLLSFPSPPPSPLLLDQLPQFLYLLHNPSTHWLHPRAHSSYWQVQRALPRRGSQVSSQAWKEVLREHIPQKRLDTARSTGRVPGQRARPAASICSFNL